MNGLRLGDVTINAIGMIHDLRARGLSWEAGWAVMMEIERRDRLYREDPDFVPPYRPDVGDGGSDE